jgi:hypothetical protein
MGLLLRRRRADAAYDDETAAPGRLAMPRRRGALTGLLILVLGAWAALVPLIGGYFSFEFSGNSEWSFSTAHVVYSIVPGVVAVIGAFMLMTSANRATATLGAQLALAAGIWLVIGPALSLLWNDGEWATGQPTGSPGKQALLWLAYFHGVGAAITALAGTAFGRVTARHARDADLLAAAAPPRRRAGGRFGRADREPVTGAAERP